MVIQNVTKPTFQGVHVCKESHLLSILAIILGNLKINGLNTILIEFDIWKLPHHSLKWLKLLMTAEVSINWPAVEGQSCSINIELSIILLNCLEEVKVKC